MVLVCNWDDPSSADVDHILDFLFIFTALFLPRDDWTKPTSTVLLNSHHSLPYIGMQYTQYLYSLVWRLSGVMAYG